MSKYTCLADGSWTSPSESAGSIQCQSGQIEICDMNADNTGIKIGQGDMIAFSGTVYVRSTNKKQAIYTAVPFDVRGGRGGGGGGGSYTLPTASATVKGGIKVGDRLSINNQGVLSADSQTSDWTSGKQYKVGDTVLINGRFYKCKTNHTSSSPINMLDWYGIYTDIPNWSANTDYEAGNVVIYNDTLYQCNTAHTSGSTFDTNKFTSIGGGGGDAKLTEAVIANTAAGAIKVNDVVAKDTTFTQFVKQLLISEIAPTVTFTATNTNSGLIKNGNTVNQTTLKLVLNDAGTGTYVSIEFMKGSTVIDTQNYVTGTSTYTYTYSTPFDTDTTFKAVLNYKKSDNTAATLTKEVKFTFVNPAYYGAVSTAPTTEADVLAVGNETVTDKRGRTVTYTLNNNKSCYCYPTSLGALTSIKDANNFEYISSYDRTTVSVTVTVGTTTSTVPYYVYTLKSPVTITGFKQIFA